ncbi:hypothetical protein R1flu_025941 [Riccia fluitans]|uniref:Uncharacterized protein n=1 Tax=Riccia fluitans TaxID=41844 RepID=A0ABD1XZK9_9MARC
MVRHGLVAQKRSGVAPAVLHGLVAHNCSGAAPATLCSLAHVMCTFVFPCPSMFVLPHLGHVWPHPVYARPAPSGSYSGCIQDTLGLMWAASRPQPGHIRATSGPHLGCINVAYKAVRLQQGLFVIKRH